MTDLQLSLIIVSIYTATLARNKTKLLIWMIALWIAMPLLTALLMRWLF